MEVKRELVMSDLDDFLWSGAKRKWLAATDEQKEDVWDRLENAFYDDVPTATDVNDMVWYDCDDIFYPQEDEVEDKDESVRRRRLKTIIENKRKMESRKKKLSRR